MSKSLLLPAVIAVVLVGIGVAGVVSSLHPTPTGEGVPSPSVSVPAVAEPSPEPIHSHEGDSTETEPPTEVDSAGKVIIPAVGMDVELSTTSVKNGIVEPPTFTEVFGLSNLGASTTAPEQGTVYLVTHACRRDPCLGNLLYTQATGEPNLYGGEDIHVDGHTYTVTATRTVGRDELPMDTEIWENVPNRLVFITCYQKPDRSGADENFITIAHRKETTQ